MSTGEIRTVRTIANRPSYKIYGNERMADVYNAACPNRKYPVKRIINTNWNKKMRAIPLIDRDQIRRPGAVGDKDTVFDGPDFSTHNGDGECVVLTADDFLNVNTGTRRLSKYEEQSKMNYEAKLLLQQTT